MATKQTHSATLSTTMATVATETHWDARWWPLTRWEAGERNQKGRLCWGIWGIIWRQTKPLASWGGGQERERKRGTEERGGEKMGESALFFLPSSERVAIDIAHLIKNVCPPHYSHTHTHTHLLLLCLQHRAAACPTLAIQTQVQDRERKTDTELGGREPGVWQGVEEAPGCSRSSSSVCVSVCASRSNMSVSESQSAWEVSPVGLGE